MGPHVESGSGESSCRVGVRERRRKIRKVWISGEFGTSVKRVRENILKIIRVARKIFV